MATKKDIVIRCYDYKQRPVVNVKVRAFYHELPGLCARVAADHGDTSGRFTPAWIDAHVDQDTQDQFYQGACQDGFDQLQEDINAEEVFDAYAQGDFKRTVVAYGRSSGWVGIEQFTADDVASWDAIDVARWHKFARFARETADGVPYQYLADIYLNRYEPWATEDDKRIARATYRDAGGL